MTDSALDDPLHALGWRYIVAAPASIIGQPLTLPHMFGATDRMEAGWTKPDMIVAYERGWNRYKLDEAAPHG